jgi:hypothetical protein
VGHWPISGKTFSLFHKVFRKLQRYFPLFKMGEMPGEDQTNRVQLQSLQMVLKSSFQKDTAC